MVPYTVCAVPAPVHAASCPLAPCPYAGCLGTADGSSCRHPLPDDELCEGFNVAGRWVDCNRPMPHGHGILSDMAMTVCDDCGATSPEPCPWDATTCGECSMMRERSVAGRSDIIPDCAAHGAYLDSED